MEGIYISSKPRVKRALVSKGRNYCSGWKRICKCPILVKRSRRRGKNTYIEMDPFSSPSPGSSSTPSSEQIMDQLKNQLAQAYAEEFMETVRNKCFTRCVTKPGTSLSGSESSCISRCVERYIEATQIIGRAIFSAPR